jgi:stage II sporulation protein AA (anti-sigma F factor antagonist)
MPLKTRQQGNATIIQIEGRLDTVNYAAFETEAVALLSNGSKMFVFDCTTLTYVSSAGLRALLTLRKRTHAMGVRMRLCQLQPAVRQVFEISGFLDIFDLHPTVEDSLA